MAARTLEDWVDSLQARGRYTFRRAEANDESGLSAEAVKKALQRLVGRGRVAKVKDYFYVIVPLEYRAAGAPPPSWFLHDLMEAMQLPYYVGLLSAAALHGAAHQQPQEFQVVTDRSVRPLVAGRARIRFFPLCVTQPRAQAGVASSLREYGGLRFQVCRRMPDFRAGRLVRPRFLTPEACFRTQDRYFVVHAVDPSSWIDRNVVQRVKNTRLRA